MKDIQRLDKVLANMGYGTRKEIKKIVKQGAVKVDGIVVKDSAAHVNPKSSTIEIWGEILEYKEFVYVMMNKPAGVVSATFDKKYRTVVDILPDEYKHFNLFPVGRLDMDTEGLLMMTNDGALAHDLLSPKKHVPKKYFALVEGEVTKEDAYIFKEGVILEDGFKTLPAQLQILKVGPGQHSEIELVIFEGKFHQVKRMFEAVNKKVKYLRRIEMGSLLLDESLGTGECRELTQKEIEDLKEYKKDGDLENIKHQVQNILIDRS